MLFTTPLLYMFSFIKFHSPIIHAGLRMAQKLTVIFQRLELKMPANVAQARSSNIFISYQVIDTIA